MDTIPDKFAMTREDNVFLAKKYLKDSVYRSAHLEGIAVTFAETEAILEDATVNNVAPKDISKVYGLRDAWRYILSALDNPIDLALLETLHQLIAREDVPWDRLGVLRTENVRISGTSFIPALPDADTIQRTITEIASSPASDTDHAISTMLYLMRTQPFLDGNKRVATLAANKILIATGHGIFSVPPELKVVFTTELVSYYESGDPTTIKSLIYDNCITGF